METNDLREARTTALNSDRTKLPAHQVVPLQIWYKYVPCIAHAVLSQHHCLGILIAPTPRRHLGSSVEQKHLQRQLTAVATDTARFPWFSLTIMDNYGDTGVISFHPLSLHDLYGLTSCSPARVQASSIPLASGMGWQRLRQWHPTDLRSESSSRYCSSPSLPH